MKIELCKLILNITKIKLKVLPENEWKLCEKCGNTAPEFAMPQCLRKELDKLSTTSPIGVLQRLRQAGASLEMANAWIFHHLNYCHKEPCTSPCPQCGKFYARHKLSNAGSAALIGIEKNRIQSPT
jgi:hypothetical protein